MICHRCKQQAPDNNYKCPNCGGVLKDNLSPSDFQTFPKKRKSLNLMPLLLGVIAVGLGLIIFFWIQQNRNKRSDYPNKNLQTKEQASLNQKKEKASEGDVSVGSQNQSDEGYKEEVPKEPEESQIYTYEYDEKKENDNQNDEPPEISHKPGERVDIEDFIYKGKMTIFDFYSDYCGPCRVISPKLEELDEKRNDIVVVKIDINREGVRGIDWRSPVVAQYQIRSIPYFIIYNEEGRRSHEGRSASQKVYELLYQEGIR